MIYTHKTFRIFPVIFLHGNSITLSIRMEKNESFYRKMISVISDRTADNRKIIDFKTDKITLNVMPGDGSVIPDIRHIDVVDLEAVVLERAEKDGVNLSDFTSSHIWIRNARLSFASFSETEDGIELVNCCLIFHPKSIQFDYEMTEISAAMNNAIDIDGEFKIYQ